MRVAVCPPCQGGGAFSNRRRWWIQRAQLPRPKRVALHAPFTFGTASAWSVRWPPPLACSSLPPYTFRLHPQTNPTTHSVFFTALCAHTSCRTCLQTSLQRRRHHHPSLTPHSGASADMAALTAGAWAPPLPTATGPSSSKAPLVLGRAPVMVPLAGRQQRRCCAGRFRAPASTAPPKPRTLRERSSAHAIMPSCSMCACADGACMPRAGRGPCDPHAQASSSSSHGDDVTHTHMRFCNAAHSCTVSPCTPATHHARAWHADRIIAACMQPSRHRTCSGCGGAQLNISCYCGSSPAGRPHHPVA